MVGAWGHGKVGRCQGKSGTKKNQKWGVNSKTWIFTSKPWVVCSKILQFAAAKSNFLCWNWEFCQILETETGFFISWIYTSPWALLITAGIFWWAGKGGSEPKTTVYLPIWAVQAYHWPPASFCTYTATASVNMDIPSRSYVKPFPISARRGGDRQNHPTNSNQEEIAIQCTSSFFVLHCR